MAPSTNWTWSSRRTPRARRVEGREAAYRRADERAMAERADAMAGWQRALDAETEREVRRLAEVAKVARAHVEALHRVADAAQLREAARWEVRNQERNVETVYRNLPQRQGTWGFQAPPTGTSDDACNSPPPPRPWSHWCLLHLRQPLGIRQARHA